MTASLVLGLAIVGTVSMLGTGTDLGRANDLRRQARVMAQEALEDPRYFFRDPNYMLEAGYRDQYNLNLATADVVPCSLLVSVVVENANWLDKNVPYRRVTARVRWPVTGYPKDSVEVSKRLAQVQ